MQLTRRQTMKRASEFALVRAAGSSRAGRFLILSTAPLPAEQADAARGDAESRFGIITTRRMGHAVERVLARRRVRELLRKHGAPLAAGRYVVVVVRTSAAQATYAEMEQDFLRLLKRTLNKQAAC
ncbi:MAG: ribonuclease P protein component [Akkermansia sp.]|nr:ribonuclease P protein component [Akkermansia sp.]